MTLDERQLAALGYRRASPPESIDDEAWRPALKAYRKAIGGPAVQYPLDPVDRETVEMLRAVVPHAPPGAFRLWARRIEGKPAGGGPLERLMREIVDDIKSIPRDHAIRAAALLDQWFRENRACQPEGLIDEGVAARPILAILTPLDIARLDLARQLLENMRGFNIGSMAVDMADLRNRIVPIEREE